MNVLLIYPESPGLLWSMEHVCRMLGKKAAIPPLSLLTVGAMLPKAWGKRLVDQMARKLTRDDLEWADMAFVAINALDIHDEPAARIIRRCKEAGLTVVAGGHYFNFSENKFEGIDHLVLREAELTLPLFLEDLQNGTPREVYDTDEYCDLTQSPVPAYELLDDVNDYLIMPLQTAKGCPHSCDFCPVAADVGPKPRTKAPEQILRELQRLYEVGWRGQVFIVNENIIGLKSHVKREVLPAIIRWQEERGRPFTFSGQCTLAVADDDELLALLVDAGVETLFFGIESLNEECHTEANKGINKGRNPYEDVRRILKAGIHPSAGFISGFDHDTPEVFQQQIDFIERAGIVQVALSKLRAFPRTKLWDRVKSEGRLDERDLSGAEFVSNTEPVMGTEALDKGYEHQFRYLYSPKPFHKRLQNALEMLGPPPRSGRREAGLGAMRMLGRIIFHLGVMGEERRFFWKTLFWTLLHRRDLIEFAIASWVLRYHLHRRFEELFGPRDYWAAARKARLRGRGDEDATNRLSAGGL